MRLRALFCIILTLTLTIATPINCLAAINADFPSVSAKSAILIDLDEKNVLFQKNARERMAMASTTKIVTALVACELLECDAIVKIPAEAVGIEGSSVYLREGEMLSVEELLYALLLESANDAAVALAICASGSVEKFAQGCNDKARSLGLYDTHFTNPHGLYDENHYTTAYDLAILTAHALNEPTIAKICASRRAEIPFGVTEDNPTGEGVRHLKNHNKMLFNYDGAIGVKTGFTKKSGRCLVSAASRNGLTLIAVTLNAPDDWRDHTAMLDFGFNDFERRVIYEVGEFSYDFPLANGNTEYLRVTNHSPILATVKKNTPTHTYYIEACFRFAIAPVTEGEILGRLYVTVNEKSYASTLVSAEAALAREEKRSLFN